ncbi:MAG: B12-binding domain-containing radical SAM protein [Armatimonadetes bacterium]|nr:B12-binding domain-containing radical SAM protein [Armatimonadota bacterium]
MIATRGCPYQCTFCSSPQMWTTRYVTRNPREVVDEIADYVARYGVTNVDFCDLTALVKREWILEFCRLLEASGLEITWQLPVGTRSEALDEEVLRAVYRTGCSNVTYAPESGSPRMLKNIKKRVHLSRLLDSLRAASRLGVVTRINTIIGHPDETRADILQTFRFVLQCALAGCRDLAVNIFAPYPGSEDFDRLVREGEITEIVPDYYFHLSRAGRGPRTFNPRMETGELTVWLYAMLVAFYAVSYLSRPRRFLDVLASVLTGREESQVDQLIRTKYRQIQLFFGARK